MLATFNSKGNQSALWAYAIKEFWFYGVTLFVDIEQLGKTYFACKNFLSSMSKKKFPQTPKSFKYLCFIHISRVFLQRQIWTVNYYVKS